MQISSKYPCFEYSGSCLASSSKSTKIDVYFFLMLDIYGSEVHNKIMIRSSLVKRLGIFLVLCCRKYMVQNLVNCGCHISPKVSILLSYAQFVSFVFRLHEITRNMILNRLITSWCTPVIRAAVSKSEKNYLAVFPLFEFPSPCFGWSIIRPSWWYCSWISFFLNFLCFFPLFHLNCQIPNHNPV